LVLEKATLNWSELEKHDHIMLFTARFSDLDERDLLSLNKNNRILLLNLI